MHATRQPLPETFARRWRLAVSLGAAFAAVSGFIATRAAVVGAPHPDRLRRAARKPAAPAGGDLVWSVPMLATLNPIGAPTAHVGVLVGAVVQDYDTNLFVPPH